jgi:hypothetical protein
MNIPLDNLYHWVQGLVQHPMILYVFRPHGSKDIFDLTQFEKNPAITYKLSLAPMVICHDQEPLNFADHKFNWDLDRLEQLLLHRGRNRDQLTIEMEFYSHLSLFPSFKPNWLSATIGYNDWFILLHSEQNSSDVNQFSHAGFVPVYYWSHAMIARDWYRFAQHDTRLCQKEIQKTFLVYCRDWMPRREYRLKFLDLLVDADLIDDCSISTQHVNNQGVHLKDYVAKDPRFAIDTKRLEVIPDNNIGPSASADYDVADINATAITVILETVVDGDKIHLTEKVLRPIACGHPFVLVAGPGSLAYLRSYGFRTFDSVFDESYDQQTDTVKRLEMVVQLMKKIQQLTDSDWAEINAIAAYNKKHFFSDSFVNQVTAELQTNLNNAIEFCLENRGDTWWRWRKILRRTRQIYQVAIFKSNLDKNTIRELRKHRSRRSKNNPSPIIAE